MKNIQENKFSISKRLRSFTYAFSGLKYAIRSQHNFRIHLGVGFIVVICGFVARLNSNEWCILMLTIGLIISMEAMNTAIEKLVDFVSPDYQKQAGVVKDVAAGAVLIAAITSVIIGVILFLPKII